MSIYRGAGGAGDAVADSSSEALLIRELAVEVQADADAAAASATSASGSATSAASSATAAASSATAAASSATSASSSASSATSSATNAASSATDAATSESNALQYSSDAADSNTDAENHATAASASATTASTQATNASNSASSASTSATNAASSASSASTSATNASNSATSASGSASTATTQASNASTSATNAAASATSASNSATTATTQAGIATTKASEASTSASNASTSASSASTSATTATTQATNSASSATAAAASATSAAASYDSFDDRYLGVKTSAPTLDNDGNALVNGALYFDSTLAAMRYYNTATTTWTSIATALSTEPVRHSVRPSLLLDFANTKQLDPRITFTRASTATYYDVDGLLKTAAAGVARFEHNPVTGESLGLEIEEQRTNFVLNSNTINASTGTGVVSNTVIAPDGTTTADIIYETAVTSEHFAEDSNIAVTTGVVYTWSAYVKDHTSADRIFYLRVATAGNATVTFNPRTEAIIATGGTNYLSSTFEKVANGWFRISVSFTASTTGTAVCRLQLMNPSYSTVYAGNGTSGLCFWGKQLEAGSFPTSYIPTVASQVTRIADAASMTGTNFSSWYRADEGTLYVESAKQSVPVSASDTLISISDGTISNILKFWIWSGAASTARFTVSVSGSNQADFSLGTVATNSFYKSSGAYKVNDLAGCLNGGTVQTDTLGTRPTVNALYIGCQAGPSTFYSGTIKKLAYYPKRLTNAELQGLTTV